MLRGMHVLKSGGFLGGVPLTGCLKNNTEEKNSEELLFGADRPCSQEGDRWESLQQLNQRRPDVHAGRSVRELKESDDSDVREPPQILRRLARHTRLPAPGNEETPVPSEHSHRRKGTDRLADRLGHPQNAGHEEASYFSKHSDWRERDRHSDRHRFKPHVEIDAEPSFAAKHQHQRGRDRLAERLSYTTDSPNEESPRRSKLPHHRLADRLRLPQSSSDNEPPFVAEHPLRKEKLRMRSGSLSTASSDEEVARARAKRDRGEQDPSSAVPRGIMGLRSDSLFSRAGSKPSRHSRS